ncbi:MAG: putative ribosomal N-acetyltransferase YdaF [Chlamydiae bacterium]|nr:putative ribosomal N-acetyltransferase YdaF [Chlamydiota bacterium]
MYLKTPHLFIRSLTKEDLECIDQLLADEGAMQFSTNTKTSQEYLENILQSYQENGYGLYGVFLKDDQVFIGLCGLLKQEINHKIYVEASYRIKKTYWNRGYATEATKAVVQYAFDQLHIKELITIIEKTNMPSMAVAKKIGFLHAFNTSLKGFDCHIFSIQNPKSYFLK